MKILNRPGATPAQVNEQCDTALTDYGASTTTQVSELNNISINQTNAACDVALSDFDGAKRAALTTVDEEVGVIDGNVDQVVSHIHHRAHWCGKSADQSGNNWGADTLTPYRAISGNGVYGADASDEAKAIGSADTPIIAGNTEFMLNRMLVIGVSVNTEYKLRFVWGTGTMAAAIVVGNVSEIMVKFDSINPQLSAGVPVETNMPMVASGTKVWVQARCATDNGTIDFYIALHEL